MNTEESYDDIVNETTPSPLNAICKDKQIPGCSKDQESESEDDITSYQPPKREATNENKPPIQSAAKRKRKTEDGEADIPSSTEAKVRKTEESIRKLQRHIDNKSCPASLRYSARANIPPDEQFKLDIKAVKQKAE